MRGCTWRKIKVALLPLDQLKIKAQTNPASLAGRGVADIFVKEGRGLYRGAGWTAARNAPGSFALFGGASVVKEYVFRLEQPRDATLFQAFVASIAGAVSRCVDVWWPVRVVDTPNDGTVPTALTTLLAPQVNKSCVGKYTRKSARCVATRRVWR